MNIVNYTQQGQGESLLLVHGLFGSCANLNMVARQLKQHYLVTNIDVRNHGHSFQINNMHYSEMAKDIIALLDHLNINTTSLLGHSMGGKIAMQTALDFPDRINQLIVADIAPVEYPPHHNRIIEGLKALDLTIIKSRKEADVQLADYVNDSGVRQFLLRNLEQVDKHFQFQCNLDFISQCYPQIMQGYQGSGKFTKPTLFIKGGKSDYLLPKHQAYIKQLFPASHAKIINDAGHWLHAEKSVIFNHLVTDFLKKFNIQ